MAVKLLVCAFENCGKSTITSKCKDALVFNLDKKDYTFEVPHVNVREYEGMTDLINFFSEKIKAYKAKYKKYPATVVFDTVTQMYTSMALYNGRKYTGYDIHNRNTMDTLEFNDFVINTLVPNNVNVVIVAHAMYDESTKRYLIPATGNFKDAGSWLSTVANSIFILKHSNKLTVYQKGLNYPSRTTLEGVEESMPIKDYNIQDHLDKLTSLQNKAGKFEL